MSAVCFVDTETTGLHPDRHEIWEVGLITPDSREHLWQFPVDEMAADPFALEVGRYWDRRWPTDLAFSDVSPVNAVYYADDPSKSRRTRFPDQGLALAPSVDWCRHFRHLTAGCHLAGAVVSFDEERLRRLLHRYGVLHRWHYHLIDVEALAVGYIAGKWSRSVEAEDGLCEPPWSSDELTAALGITVDVADKHTALGDARWAKAIYEAVMTKGGMASATQTTVETGPYPRRRGRTPGSRNGHRTHGRISTYTSGCRCDYCRSAWAEWNREARAEGRQQGKQRAKSKAATLHPATTGVGTTALVNPVTDETVPGVALVPE